MKRGIDIFLHIVAAIFVVATLSSCRTELCYDHFRRLDLNINYEYEWERDYGHHYSQNWDEDFYGTAYDALRPDKPEWLVAIKYNGDERPNEYYLEPDNGKIIIDGSEEESILVYNGDTEYILLSDMASLPGARASATGRSRASLEHIRSEFVGSSSTNPPDVLYSAYIKPLPDVQLHETRTHEVKMQPLVFTYLVRYEFEYGLEHVALARGALGGMAETIYLRDGSTPQNKTIVLYDCDLTSYGCEAAVRSFGVPEFDDMYFTRLRARTVGNRYLLNLEVLLKNGKTVEFNFDVTDQIELQPRGGVITVSGIRIEDEQNLSASGFNVDLSDWGESVEIELPVGHDRNQ